MFFVVVLLEVLLLSRSIAAQGACKACVDQKLWLNTTCYADIHCNPDFPSTPDEDNPCALDSFDQQLDQDNFLAELCTYFTAPMDGDYTFYMACDSLCILSISGVEMAFVWPKTGYQQWEERAEQQQQKNLSEGDCVKVCAVVGHGCGATDDHLSVGVKYPNGTLDRPISKHITRMCPDADICSTSPCEHGGTCEFSPEEEDCYRCTCATCYNGTTCEEEKMKCEPNPCENDGTCIFDDSRDSCQSCNCSACYEGVYCEEPVNSCYGDPCENGGVCSWLNVGPDCFECDCSGTCYTGNTCSEAQDPCSSNPCQNGGTCVLQSDEPDCFKCSCNKCYSGDKCEIARDPCSEGLCRNNGTCVFDDSSASCMKCQCSPCFQGEFCDTPIDNCTTSTCDNGGTCRFDAEKEDCFACECSRCYSGETCQLEDDPCSTEPCHNGGNCTFNGTLDCCHSCACSQCFTGKDCQTPINPCDNNPCKNGGSCVLDEEEPECYKCYCDHCYTGQNCETERNTCDTVICPNQGECRPDIESKTCARCDGCADLWTNCSSMANLCRSSDKDVYTAMAKNCRKTCDLCCACEGGCDIGFSKLRCVRYPNGSFNELLFSVRDEVNWNTWSMDLPSFVCRCAKKAAEKNHDFFTATFWGECRVGEVTEDMIKAMGGSNGCRDRYWHSCSKDRSEEAWDHSSVKSNPHYCCVGGGNVGCVYKIHSHIKIEACETWDG